MPKNRKKHGHRERKSVSCAKVRAASIENVTVPVSTIKVILPLLIL